MEQGLQDPEFWKKWSRNRGPMGDEYQRYIIKPFFAAFASFLEEERDQDLTRDIGTKFRLTKERFFDAMSKVSPEDLERALKEMAGSALDRLTVLDLGCGEAFLGRWLVGMGASYLGLDNEKDQIAEAMRKEKESGRETPVLRRTVDPQLIPDLSALLQNACGRGHPDIVAATAFLDHVEDYQGLMRRLADWAVEAERPPDFLLATLNPFYFSALPKIEKHRAEPPLTTGRMSIWLRQGESNAFMRWPAEYERAFVDAGFHVLSATCSDHGRLPPAVREALRTRHQADETPVDVLRDSYVGPFILWALRPRSKGQVLDREHLARLATATSGPMHDISRVAAACENELEFQLVRHAPHSIVEHAGGLGGRGYVVLEGSALRLDGVSKAVRAEPPRTREQRFGPGELFGEFEAGPNLSSDRFKDDVVAGPAGCLLLEMPERTLRELNSGTGANLGHILFAALRERISQYSWIWSTRITAKGKRQSESDASDRTCEHFARALLYGLTREARDRKDSGPAVLVADVKELLAFIYSDDSSETFDTGFKRFISAGIVDAGIWPIAYPTNINTVGEQVWKLAHSTWQKAVSEVFDIVAGDRPLPDELRDAVISDIAPAADHSIRKKEIANTSGPISFTRYAQDKIREEIYRRSQPEWEEIATEWLANLAALQETVFSQTRSLIFVRDEERLRDIVKLGGGQRLIEVRNVPDDQHWSGMELSRWHEYSEVTLAHIRFTLANDGHFASTAAKLNFATDIYAALTGGAQPGPNGAGVETSVRGPTIATGSAGAD